MAEQKIEFPQLFKHMRSEHAVLLTKGMIRLSSLAYFRDIEGAPNGIQDAEEGTLVKKFGSFYAGNESDEIKAKIRSHGLNPNAWYIGGKVTSRLKQNYYIFSMTTLETPDLFGSEYNAIASLPHAVQLAGEILKSRPDVFIGVEIGEVNYRPTTVTLDGSGFNLDYGPDPFIKDNRFESQSEFRFAFHAVDDHKFSDFMDIEVPALVPFYEKGTVGTY